MGIVTVAMLSKLKKIIRRAFGLGVLSIFLFIVLVLFRTQRQGVACMVRNNGL